MTDSSPPGVSIQESLVSPVFWGVDLQPCIYWRRTHNCCSLQLRTYLHFGDSVFQLSLQVTATVTLSLIATSPTLLSVDSLGNGLLCDHAQADLPSAKSEWYFVPQRSTWPKLLSPAHTKTSPVVAEPLSQALLLLWYFKKWAFFSSRTIFHLE